MDKEYKPEPADSDFISKMNGKCCKYNHGSDETCEQVAERFKQLMEAANFIKSGYAGVLPNGNIVDRRKHPEAIVCKKNDYLGIPEPKEINP